MASAARQGVLTEIETLWRFGMKKSLVAAALVAGMVGPVSAATVLDFTKNDNTSGFVGGGVVTGSNTLTQARHKTDDGCEGTGWDFDCRKIGSRYDVGFGVQGGGNNNEIDGIRNGEWVQVTFNYAVKILGFAGMLTYFDSQNTGGYDTEDGYETTKGYETVVLQYLDENGNWVLADEAMPLNDDNDPSDIGDNKFDKVGLAWLKGLDINTTAVRFLAGGMKPFDDGNANVTASGLIIAPVPVPASFPLLLAGIGALGWAARRKRKAA
jgi:hypothetical protein